MSLREFVQFCFLCLLHDHFLKKNATGFYWSPKYNFLHKTCTWKLQLRYSYYKTYGISTHPLQSMHVFNNVHKGVISQVDLYTNVTLYNIKKTLWYIIFHRDQYFTFWWNMNASMSFNLLEMSESMQHRGANHNVQHWSSLTDNINNTIKTTWVAQWFKPHKQ